LANDTDADSAANGETRTVTAVNGVAANVGSPMAGLYGTVTIGADGTYHYAVNNNNPAVLALDGGKTLTETFTYTMQDASGLSSSATLTITIQGQTRFFLPAVAQDNHEHIDTSNVHGQFGDFSGMVTNKGAPDGAADGLGFVPGAAIHVIHADITATIGDNGSIAFDFPLLPLEAALDGDVVSITATLPDGRPLPSWLAFNTETGKFAGLVPDDVLTGSVRPDGGIAAQSPAEPRPQSMTIEVVARDSKGNMAIIDFTLDLSVPAGRKVDKQGWNMLPGGKALDPWGPNHRDVVLPAAGDHVLAHGGPVFDLDRVRAHHEAAPAGRAGFSDQLKSHGWHAVSAGRTALLESLRQGAAGWR
jgi:VCBS repeat-containing protein